MKTLSSAIYSFIFLVTTAGLTQSAQAQAQSDRWFRVELLVFSHETGSADRAESWEPLPALGYPSAVRFLVNTDQVERNIDEVGQDSVVDARGVQTIELPPLESQRNDGREPKQNSTDIPRRNSQPDLKTTSNSAAASSDPIVEDNAAMLPAPFVQRAAAEREFRGKAAYMQRMGNYRTLYHQTWLQPMRDESSALPIVLDRSGDTLDWPQLQGTVKIYLSRYLHVETDLWLNTTGNYLPGEWAMPAAPLGPPSLIVIEPEPSLSEPTIESGEIDELAQAKSTLEPAYPWRHAVRFNEKRRMRSNEVHYLDHPMLGVVIKFTPVAQDELQALAEADLAKAEAAL